MIDFDRYFDVWWHKNNPAPADLLARLGKTVLINAPEDYLCFLGWGNGGEGFTGKVYIRLWKAESLERLNALYDVQANIPSALAIGDDGPNAILLNSRVKVCLVPFGDMHRDNIVQLAPSFKTFVKRIVSIEPGGLHLYPKVSDEVLLRYRVTSEHSASSQAFKLSRILEKVIDTNSREILIGLESFGEYKLERLERYKAEQVLQAASECGICIEILENE